MASSCSLGPWVCTLITPAVTFLPCSVLCGPFSTSTELTSTRSPIPIPERERNAPSIKRPVAGSKFGIFPALPILRMRKVVASGLILVSTISDGTCAAISPISLKPISTSWSAVSADTDTGTVCISSWRFCAVTITSSNCAACIGVAEMAATAASPQNP